MLQKSLRFFAHGWTNLLVVAATMATIAGWQPTAALSALTLTLILVPAFAALLWAERMSAIPPPATETESVSTLLRLGGPGRPLE